MSKPNETREVRLPITETATIDGIRITFVDIGSFQSADGLQLCARLSIPEGCHYRLHPSGKDIEPEPSLWGRVLRFFTPASGD